MINAYNTSGTSPTGAPKAPRPPRIRPGVLAASKILLQIENFQPTDRSVSGLKDGGRDRSARQTTEVK